MYLVPIEVSNDNTSVPSNNDFITGEFKPEIKLDLRQHAQTPKAKDEGVEIRLVMGSDKMV